MAVISVEISDKIAHFFEPFSIVKYETLVDKVNSNMEFDFKKENIEQNEFLAYLQKKHG